MRPGSLGHVVKPCSEPRSSPARPAKGQATRAQIAGIDFGTSNSAIAVPGKKRPRIVEHQPSGRPTLPSVVNFPADGVVLIGEEAQRSQQGLTLYSVKRLIGRTFRGAADLIPSLGYEVTEGEGGNVVIPCPAASEGNLLPEEIASLIISHLLQSAEESCGSHITKAVISVPAYFDSRQKAAIIQAGTMAGLETVRLVREPVAAAMAYGLNLKQDQTVLVFDLGGGTLDVSLLEVGGGTIEVLSSGGDPFLGGDDWTGAIVQWLIKDHLRPAGIDTSSRSVQRNLRAVAEAAKIRLSDSETVALGMPFRDRSGAPLRVELSREKFDQLAAPLFSRARDALDRAAWQAGVDLQTAMDERDELARRARRSGGGRRNKGSSASPEIATEIRPKRRAPLSKILLVGGATRMPSVPRFLENMTGTQPVATNLDPDQAVALGAAIQAGMLEGTLGDLMVMDPLQAGLLRALASRHTQNQQMLGSSDAKLQ
ncbi:hypothetical protein WJX74_002754 [Apatococcus lobatus]|uniref:Molecular chaperone DnaK n=1 Tax=Apatococcus lobatus TaxID=904363 RepID=A0AAW1RHF8_9CHLO